MKNILGLEIKLVRICEILCKQTEKNNRQTKTREDRHWTII